MANFKEGQGVKTHRDDDFCTKIADGNSGAAATRKLTIANEGDTIVGGTNDSGIPFLVRKEDGTYCLPAADDNCVLKVAVVGEADDDKSHSYKNHSAVTASGGTDDHDAIVTSAKTVDEVDVILSSPGCFQYDIGEFDGTSTFDVRATLWTQPASPSVCCKICLPEITGDGSIALRIRATNQDDNDNDAYSTMCYTEKTA